jgi:TRAP-type C4-dicarboxylate transport system permease small subunit
MSGNTESDSGTDAGVDAVPSLDQRLYDALDRWIGGLLAAMMGLSVLVVLWQVASRYLLADPSSFTDELVRYLLVWIGILGGAFGVGRRLHLAIDLLPQALTGRRRHLLAVVIHGLVMLFAVAVMGVGGGNLVALSHDLGQRSAALGVGVGWVYAVLPMAALLIVIYGLLFAVDQARQARGLPSRLCSASEPDPLDTAGAD